jgi:hypothetical protein
MVGLRLLPASASEKGDDLVIGNLSKVLVPETNREKVGWRVETDDTVHLGCELLERVR